jgi:acetyl esterase/lipase
MSITIKKKLIHVLLNNVGIFKNGGSSNLCTSRKRLEFLSRFSIHAKGVNFTPDNIQDIPVEWVTPQINTCHNSVILYIHGGGFSIGSNSTHRGIASHIAKESNTTVLLLDYRLAPENPYPAGLNDIIAVYKWLLENEFDSTNIAICGDSAGGGLVLSSLLWLRDNKETLPGCAVCISPWVNLSNSYLDDEIIDPVLHRSWLEIASEKYMAGENPRSPLISPIFADLSGLPPLLIQVGTQEILLNDSIQLNKKAEKYGVKVKLDVWNDMWHVWHAFTGYIPEANQAIKEIGIFIQKHINSNQLDKVKHSEIQTR